MRRTLTLLAMVGLLALTTAPVASAAPAPREARPTECLDAFDRREDDYIGEGWIGTLVSGPPGRTPFDWLFGDDTDRDYSLHCGNEWTGVVHIAHFEGTGSEHPIDEYTEDGFVRCWGRTIASGEADVDPVSGRTTFTLDVGRGVKSIAIVDTERRFTYTLYTTGDVSNDWSGCYVVRM